MGIIENVVGSLLGGGNQNQSSGMGGVLSDILGGGAAGSNSGMANQGMGQGGFGGSIGGNSGGLGNLISMFEGAGLGHIIQSWIGNGQNSSVSPDQLNQVFGNQVPGMAQQAGMSQGDFLDQLSQHLPGAVDNSTPNGATDNGSVSV